MEKRETLKQMIPVYKKKNGTNATRICSTKEAKELQLALPRGIKKCFGKGG